MPALVVLAIAGVVLLVRRGAPTSFRVAAIGAAVGCCTVFFFCYIAYRYVGDFIPFLVVTGVVAIDALIGRGLTAVAPIRDRRPGGPRGVRHLGERRARGAPARRVELADSTRATSRVSSTPASASTTSSASSRRSCTRSRRAGACPRTPTPGDFAIVGDCDALYIFSGTKPNFLEPTTWRPVERTRRSGSRRFTARLHAAPKGTIEPLLAIGRPGPSGRPRARAPRRRPRPARVAGPPRPVPRARVHAHAGHPPPRRGRRSLPQPVARRRRRRQAARRLLRHERARHDARAS